MLMLQRRRVLCSYRREEGIVNVKHTIPGMTHRHVLVHAKENIGSAAFALGNTVCLARSHCHMRICVDEEVTLSLRVEP